MDGGATPGTGDEPRDRDPGVRGPARRAIGAARSVHL